MSFANRLFHPGARAGAAVAALAAWGCSTMDQPSTPPPTTPTPTATPPASPGLAVVHAVDVFAKSGSLVEVFGTYRVVAADKLERADAADRAAASGHAAIELGDGTRIHLQPPWHPDAVRGDAERTKFADQAVVVKGLLFDECPPPGDGRAYAKVACLHSELAIMARSTYDRLHGPR